MSFRALFRGFLDISDGLGDRAFQVDPDRRRLHDCRLVFRMSDAHGSSLSCEAAIVGPKEFSISPL